MAGNKANWVKANTGPHKGTAYYVPNARERSPDALQRLANAGRLTSQPPRGAAVRVTDPGLGGTPIPRAAALDVKTASAAYTRAPESYQGEDQQLAAIYTRQGYHAKPDVLTSGRIDGYVKAGEIEVFRGTRGTAQNPDVHNEALRSGATHYAGRGIFGNGTYTAVSETEARGYAGADGTVLRMTIKRGAKIGDYARLDRERVAAQEAMAKAPGMQVYNRALVALNRERNQISASGLPASEITARVRSLDARAARIRARQEREYPQAIYQDVGAYAASKGYDAFTHNADYMHGRAYVILNRGALRIQERSLPGGSATVAPWGD